MTLSNLLLFIVACFALNMAPGPNNLMAMNNARNFGLTASIIGGIGRIAAFTIMIALAASGLAVVLLASETLFLCIKIMGAAYLFWIALNLWNSKIARVPGTNETQNHSQLIKQEFLLAIGNPKAILIFTAFLPQFVKPSESLETQFLLLGTTFLLLELVAITIYAAFGMYLGQWFTNTKIATRFNRACATFLAFSGLNLVFSRQ